MTNEVIQPMPSIGVDMYHYAKVLEDVKGGETTYGTPKPLPGAVEIAPTDSGGVAVFDGDNGSYRALPYTEKMGHDITNADIPAEIDAEWRGLEMKDGGVEFGGIPKAPHFCAMWRVLKANGVYRYVRYYKGVYSFASNVGAKTKPSSGAPDFQTAKATFTSENRLSDGMAYYMIDDDKLPDGVTPEIIEEKWFTDANWYPKDEAAASGV